MDDVTLLRRLTFSKAVFAIDGYRVICRNDTDIEVVSLIWSLRRIRSTENDF